jgi:hypothetical protein
LFLAIALGVTVGGLVVLAVISGTTLDVEPRTAHEAAAEMDAVRSRYTGQVPCLERDARDRAASRREGDKPRTVHVLAWEREDNRLVRVRTPYWVLQVGAFKIHAAHAIAPPLEHVTPADLDQCGRGLVADRRTSGGGRVLIWAE